MNYSFHNIEQIVEQIINKDIGFFVDIGAHDGVSGNNTKYFEDKGWSGICIEPHPEVFNKLVLNRSCKLFNCAVWESDKQIEFLVASGYPEMLSGIIESYDPRHYERVQREVLSAGSSRIEIIEAKKFESLVETKDIDFLSIDTEGSEMKILSKIDFDIYNIKVICIENNFNDPSFELFFIDRGYKLHSTHGGCDQIYYKL